MVTLGHFGAPTPFGGKGWWMGASFCSLGTSSWELTGDRGRGSLREIVGWERGKGRRTGIVDTPRLCSLAIDKWTTRGQSETGRYNWKFLEVQGALGSLGGQGVGRGSELP